MAYEHDLAWNTINEGGHFVHKEHEGGWKTFLVDAYGEMVPGTWAPVKWTFVEAGLISKVSETLGSTSEKYEAIYR